MKRKITLSVLLGVLCSSLFTAAATAEEAPQVTAARGVIQRAIGDRHKEFTLELIDKANGKDVFEIESKDGKIIVRGSTGVAICSGFNWYLKYHCNCSIHWSGKQVNLPTPLPAVKAKIRTVSPYKYRAYLNYCVFSYTMSFWHWDRWQQEIDWMALNGINMPLQVVGHEAVWLATFKKFGLSDEEMQKFFTGPAYFAWHWMTNIDGVGGPLPMSWIKSHAKLGRQILDRQRSLGMTPMLNGFSGRVPGALKKHYPNCKIQQERSWGGCPGTFQMDPLDPMFKKVGETFYKEQIRLFGTSHLYATDPFHEGAPPSNDPKYLSQVGKVIYDTMAAADPKAIWCMQSWSLRTPIMLAAPKDRLIVLDLNGARTWNRKNPWHGRDSIWGILNNFGGRHYMKGSLAHLLSRCNQTKRQSANVVGFGNFDEAIELNPVISEALYECAWRNESPEPKQWAYQYAHRRYGQDTPDIRKAWDALLATVYSGRQGGYGALLRARPAISIHKSSPCNGELRFNYDNRKLAEAWKYLNAAGDKCKTAPGYRFDLINVAEQALNNLAIGIHHELVRAYKSGDKEAFQTAGKQLLELITDLDTLQATHEMFLLGKWISDARKWGTTEAEKNLYEYNARALVSVWEADHVGKFFDYAARSWSGLYRDFYYPRWKTFIDMLQKKLDAGDTTYTDARLARGWNRPTRAASPFYKKLSQWEHAWPKKRNAFSDKPTGDLLAVSRKLCDKYYPIIQQAYKNAQAGGYSVNQSHRESSKKKIKVKKTNITSGKPVKTQGRTEGQNVPEYAVDGMVNGRQYWAASKTPCWLRVDLKKATNINGAQVWFYWAEPRYYQYVIETSNDGLAWHTVVDASKSTTLSTAKGYTHTFSTVSCRYVRIRILKNSANPASHLVEFQLTPATK